MLTVGASGNNIASFYTSGSSQVMTLDASGNLMVGTTSSSTATQGIKLRSDIDAIAAVADGQISGYFGRLNSDGDILNFRKDGTTVGSIGVQGDRIYLAGVNEAVGIDDSWNAFVPLATGGGNSDADTDLGNPSSRFKDLYLSGSITLAAGSQINSSTAFYLDSDIIHFRLNNEQESARIDSSRNFLVGKTDTTFSTSGIELRAGNNGARFIRSNAEPVLMNRTGSDGKVLGIYKDGTEVGSIGTDNGIPYFLRTSGGIAIGNTALLSADSSGAINDATSDLGGASNRWKDLYLSGTGFVERISTDHDGDWGLEMTGVTSARIRFNSSAGGSTQVGSITVSTTATAYNTSSDHRLKENVVAMSGATERLKQLAPKRFNFIADADTTVDGFLAHEVQAVVPEAITGTHNEVDSDGNPVYQGIDQSKLVPLLVATIQELEARIAALESN
jgi:hypothetical protein